jgi:hypothetical protein
LLSELLRVLSSSEATLHDLLRGRYATVFRSSQLYLLLGEDACPIHLVCVGGSIFRNRGHVARFLAEIDAAYFGQLPLAKTAAVAMTTTPDDISEAYWQQLLVDIDTSIVGEGFKSACATGIVHSSLRVHPLNKVSSQERLREAILSSWAIVVHRHAGIDDVLFGERKWLTPNTLPTTLTIYTFAFSSRWR